MRIFLIFALFILCLNAYEVRIKSIEGNNISVDKYVKKGVSGIVLCPFENREIICARAVLFGTEGRLEIYDSLKNPAFALPVVTPKRGDKIILAKNYNRVMIIAPNQESYLKTESLFKNRTFISPDVFAAFLSEIPTREDFVKFAKKTDIGLYVFVLDKIYLVDAYSFYAVKKYSLKENYSYIKPFFVTYTDFKISGGILSGVKTLFKPHIKNFKKYYKSLIKE